MNVVPLPQKPASSVPAASAKCLRELADMIEAGEIEELIIGAGFEGGGYKSYFFASARNSVVLASILNRHALAVVLGEA